LNGAIATPPKPPHLALVAAEPPAHPTPPPPAPAAIPAHASGPIVKIDDGAAAHRTALVPRNAGVLGLR
jgi:hypothetical protein